MSVSGNDLEILEAWLDGELADDQVAALRRRLAEEPQLHQAMDQLQSDRQLRAQLWPTLQSSDAEIATLVNNVRSAVRKDEMWSTRLHALRNISAIAASIMLVFTMGWISHSRMRSSGVDITSLHNNPQVATNISNDNQIKFMPINRGPNFVNAPAPNANGIESAAYQLQILDRQGRVVAVQPLNKLDNPQKFFAGMDRFDSRQQQHNPSDPILVDHEQP